jgi:ParB family transcriptional regulator, chromosome partitioning protein
LAGVSRRRTPVKPQSPVPTFRARAALTPFTLHVDISFTLSHSGRMAKPALGRGLSALLGGATIPGMPPSELPAPPTTSVVAIPPPTGSQEQVERVPLDRIRPCSLQPRKDFAPESLRELADSIRAQGIVQPLVVRPRGNHLELIAGERRWRAAQLAGLSEVPVIRREADDRAALELALIENLQRENLNPIEEAQGYARLIEQFSLTQEEAAAKVGKSRAVVANALRLLKLAPSIETDVREGRLSVGHAKVILGLASEKLQLQAAQRVLKEALNVRQTEGLVAKFQSHNSGPAKTGSMPVPTRDAHVARLEDRLRERLGTKVHLRYAQGKGVLEIAFFSDDDLDRVLQLLGLSAE